MIDRQYIQTQEVIYKLLLVYLYGFIIPFAINIYYQGNLYFQIVLTTCGMTTQLFFLSLEYPEIKYIGYDDYFESMWNYADLSQILFYTASLILQVWTTDEHNWTLLTRNLMVIICLF